MCNNLDNASSAEQGHSRMILIILLALIVAMACGLRLYASSKKVSLGTDEAEYLMAGRNLWRGNGLALAPGQPFVIHPPLHGIIVAGVARILHITDLKMANNLCIAIFGGLGCIAMFLLAFLFWGYVTGILAAALYATIPILSVKVYYFNSTVEHLFILFMLLGCYGFARSYMGNRMTGAIVGAAFLGIASFVRSDGLILVLCLVAVLSLKKFARREWSWTKLALCMLFCAAGFFIAYLPYGLFLLRHTGNMTSNVATYTFKNYDPIRKQDDSLYSERPGTVDASESALEYAVRDLRSFSRRLILNARLVLGGLPKLLPYYLLPFIGLALFAKQGSEEKTFHLLFIVAISIPVFSYILFYVSTRFLCVMVPAMILLVAHGLALIDVKRRWLRIAIQFLVILVLTFHSIKTSVQWDQGKTVKLGVYQKTAQWIAKHSDHDDLLMARKPQIAFYADRFFVRLPYVSDEKSLYDTAKKTNAKYVVFDERKILEYRPPLEFLLNKDLMSKSSYFEVSYADWIQGNRIVVLRPHEVIR